MSMSEREAAMAWTRLAEGDDYAAFRLVGERGYVGAYEVVAQHVRGGEVPRDYTRAAARWAPRFDEALFAADREALARLGASFTFPGAPDWPAHFDLLGEARPLGLWYLGPLEALASPTIAIVGSRDCTSYGRSLARDIAFELASCGIGVVSGGALGIDAAAHEGVVTASAGGQAAVGGWGLAGAGGGGSPGVPLVAFANGLGRFYPRANEPLFEAIADVGGLFFTEAPPEASPHRYRFLSRNRLIAAAGLATIVIEAPYRSGALSTAHHALTIGREVGAIPGPVTSPHSAGCHRLVREGAVLLRSVADVLELAGLEPLASGGGAAGAGGSARSGASGRGRPSGGRGRPSGGGAQGPSGPPNGSTHPLAARVYEGLQRGRVRSPAQIAQATGVGVREALEGLATLEASGYARNVDGRWKLA